jgi:uncharacterized protein
MTKRTYPAGVPSWVDVEERHLELAQRFYGGLFGWTFAEVSGPEEAGRYLVARLDGQDVAGLSGPRAAPDGVPAQPEAPTRWHTYVAVDDADTTAARVEAAGGRVVTPPTDTRSAGRWAECEDPDGARFRLWQARGRAGAQVVNAPGSWNFSDLHAADPERMRGFYAEVFGWAFDDLGFAEMIRQPGYGDHLEATTDPDIRSRQAGIEAPPGFEDAVGWLVRAEEETPGWQVTFAVADRDETVTAVERLGGTVLSRAEDAWARTALVRDPQGALLTVSEFAPTGS